jgi:acyl carrier protein
MPDRSIALRAIMAGVFECDADDIDRAAEINVTVGWDSLSHIRLMLELGNQGIPISTTQIPNLTSFAAIEALLTQSGFRVDA